MSVEETRHFSSWYSQNIAPLNFPDVPYVTCTCNMPRVESVLIGVAALIQAWMTFAAFSTLSPVLFFIEPKWVRWESAWIIFVDFPDLLSPENRIYCGSLWCNASWYAPSATANMWGSLSDRDLHSYFLWYWKNKIIQANKYIVKFIIFFKLKSLINLLLPRCKGPR